MANALERKYIYKVYRDNEYLGILPNVKSDFDLNHRINSAGAGLQIEVGESADKQFEAPEPILTEAGEPILTEAGEPLLTEGTPDIFGNNNSKALIRNNNDIEVYELSANYPNGKLVFSGYISKWRLIYGGSDNVVMSCLSHGTELDNHLITSGTTEQAAQEVADAQVVGTFWGAAYAQVLTPATTISVDKVVLKLSTTGADVSIAEVILCQGDPSLDTLNVVGGKTSYTLGGTNTELARSTGAVVSGSTPTLKTFTFPETQVLTGTASYYFLIVASAGVSSTLLLEAMSGTPSAPIGRLYYALAPINNASFSMNLDSGKEALYCEFYSFDGNTTSAYSEQDPTLILRDIIDNYVGQGGLVNYDADSTDLTGVSRAYTFKVNTTLEGIQKILSLSPSNFYWYVDPATNILYFKETATTAEHRMIYGRHFETLDFEASIEDSKNTVFFTGGDVGGGVNLFQTQTDTEALEAAAGRVGLARVTDNRVTLSDTASAIMQNIIDSESGESYIVSMEVNNDVYDTTLFKWGQVVGLYSLGNALDGQLLQIVQIHRKPDSVILSLGKLFKRSSDFLEEALRRLDEVETVDNPTAPS